MAATQDDSPIDPRFLFNTDQSSFSLAPGKVKVYVDDESMEYAREHARAPACQQEQQPDRYAYWLPTISADGRLLCGVMIVYDNVFPVGNMYLV